MEWFVEIVDYWICYVSENRQLFGSDYISFKWYMSVGSIAIYMNVQYKSFILVTNVGIFFSYKSLIFFLYTVNYILEIQSTLTTFWNWDYT